MKVCAKFGNHRVRRNTQLKLYAYAGGRLARWNNNAFAFLHLRIGAAMTLHQRIYCGYGHVGRAVIAAHYHCGCWHGRSRVLRVPLFAHCYKQPERYRQQHNAATAQYEPVPYEPVGDHLYGGRYHIERNKTHSRGYAQGA